MRLGRARRYAEVIAKELRMIEKKINRLPKTLVVAPNTKEANFLYDEIK